MLLESKNKASQKEELMCRAFQEKFATIFMANKYYQ